jgi:hypothetical protein
LLVGCSKDGPGETSIGPGGGEVRADGFVLSVPAEALSETVGIRVVSTDVGPEVPGRVRISRVFQVLPETVQFVIPVTVTIPYLSERLPSGVLARSADVRRSNVTRAIERLDGLPVDDSAQIVFGDSLSLGTFWATAPTGPQPVSAKILPELQVVSQGQQAQYQVEFRDQSDVLMEGVAVTWTTSDPAVATVDDAGLATALAPGPVVIMASAGAAQGRARLKVASTAPFPRSFTWENPVPQANTLWAVSGDDSRVLMAGAEGMVVLREGADWSRLLTMPSTVFRGLAVRPSEVVAVGTRSGQGLLVRWDGTQLSELAVPDTELTSIWGDASVAAALGDGPNLAMLDEAGDWMVSPTPVTEPLLAAGSRAGEVDRELFVVGARGSVDRYSHGEWLPLSASAPLEQIQIAAVTEGEEAWAVSADTLRHFSVEAGWTTVTTPEGLAFHALGLAGDSLLMAAEGPGGQTTLLVGNGSGFDSYRPNGMGRINALWGRSAGDLFAVGDRGAVWHFDGTEWSSLLEGSTADVVGLVAFDSGQVFAAANACLNFACTAQQGLVLERGTDGRFTPMSGPFTFRLVGLGGAAADDFWAVGQGGYAFRWDGATWASVSVPATLLTSVLSCPREVWAAGESGTEVDATGVGSGGGNAIFREGAGIFHSAVQVDRRLYGAACAGRDLFAVGESLVIRVEAGEALVLNPYDDAIRNATWRTVFATEDGQAFIGGDAGWILHWTGSNFEAHDSPGDLPVDGVEALWGTDIGNIWAVGALGGGGSFLIHYNGAVWERISTGSDRLLSAGAGIPGGNVWLGGEAGTILRGTPQP